MAKTIEERFMEPVLNLVFMTGIQHIDFNDPKMIQVLGEEAAGMFAARRQDFKNSISFRVRGLSGIIERQTKLRNFLAMLQTIGSNELLLQQFMQKYDIGKAFDKLMRLFGIDTKELEMTQRERLIRETAGQPDPDQTAPPRKLNGGDVTGDIR